MPTFPLLTLDPGILPAIFKRICDKLTITDLFRISLCSKRMKNLVKEATKDYEIEVEIRCHIWITLNAKILPSRGYTRWEFYDKRSPHSAKGPYDKWIDWTFNGTPMKLNHLVDYVITDRCPELGQLRVLEYLLTIFTVRIKEIVIRGDYCDCLKEIFLSPSFPKCQQLKIYEGVCTEEEMSLMLCNYKGILSTSIYPGPDFRYTQPITIPTFYLYGSRWFNRQNLLEIQSHKICLERSGLKEEDLRDFVNQWLETDKDTGLKWLIVGGKDRSNGKWGFESLDYTKIVQGFRLQGIDPIPIDKQKFEDAEYHHQIQFDSINFEESVTLRRPSDGMLATIGKPRDTAHRPFFAFFVWHSLFD